MNGVKLTSLEADDMVDVLHYLFEEDLHVSSAEEVESISKTRTLIYKDLYQKEYKYSVTLDKNKDNQNYSFDGEDIYPDDGLQGSNQVIPFNPDGGPTGERKSYIPPTEFNPESPMPFGTDLDAPLN